MKIKGLLKEYEIVGRKVPKHGSEQTPLYRMQIFAPDPIVAKSRFWYFLSHLKKCKKTNGEIVSLKLVEEKSPTKIKNFGVWLRYNSRSGTHNMYREVRSTMRAAAVTLIYRTMAAMHQARAHSIQIIKVKKLKQEEVRRPFIKQYINCIKFPILRRKYNRKRLPNFAFRRATTFAI